MCSSASNGTGPVQMHNPFPPPPLPLPGTPASAPSTRAPARTGSETATAPAKNTPSPNEGTRRPKEAETRPIRLRAKSHIATIQKLSSWLITKRILQTGQSFAGADRPILRTRASRPMLQMGMAEVRLPAVRYLLSQLSALPAHGRPRRGPLTSPAGPAKASPYGPVFRLPLLSRVPADDRPDTSA